MQIIHNKNTQHFWCCNSDTNSFSKMIETFDECPIFQNASNVNNNHHKKIAMFFFTWYITTCCFYLGFRLK